MSSQTKEQSVKSSYTVVYELRNKEWVALGNGGWSEVHLCSDIEDGTFRILAWSVETQEVLLNASVTENCVYKGSKKPNFHSFQSENGKYGLGFHKSEDALKQANEFLKTISSVVTQLKKQAAGTRQSTLVPDKVQNSLVKEGLISTKDFKALGNLKILPPKPGKHRGADKLIHDPQQVKHERHGYWDPKEQKFKGNFPPGFDKELNKQFGVRAKTIAREHVKGYKEKIPCILVQLKNMLIKHGAYDEVGLFRLAPDATTCDQLKTIINQGNRDWTKHKFAEDVNVCANLLKVWFRELPKPILNQVDRSDIEKSQKIEEVAKAVGNFPEPAQSILIWLWDLCVEVAAHKETNKMTPQNLAIVIGPNLFNTTEIQNPMAAMTFSGKVVVFFQKGIEWRMDVAKKKRKK